MNSIRNNRNNDNVIHFSDIQTVVEDVLIPKLNDAISHFDNVLEIPHILFFMLWSPLVLS